MAELYELGFHDLTLTDSVRLLSDVIATYGGGSATFMEGSEEDWREYDEHELIRCLPESGMYLGRFASLRFPGMSADFVSPLFMIWQMDDGSCTLDLDIEFPPKQPMPEVVEAIFEVAKKYASRYPGCKYACGIMEVFQEPIQVEDYFFIGEEMGLLLEYHWRQDEGAS